MGKRGQNKHLKRIASPMSMGLSNKKGHVWVSKPNAGPHDYKHSIPLSVLLRDILNVCTTNKEAKRMLSDRFVLVDGRVRTDEKFSVGLMDVISLKEMGKYYIMSIEKHGRLIPVEIKEGDSSKKIAKVVKKFTGKKGEIMVTLGDGKTLKADNNVKVGDSVILSIPNNKISEILKMGGDALCLVKGGKHSGFVASIEEVISHGIGRSDEAKMKTSSGDEFITTTDHLLVINDILTGVL